MIEGKVTTYMTYRQEVLSLQSITQPLQWLNMHSHCLLCFPNFYDCPIAFLKILCTGRRSVLCTEVVKYTLYTIIFYIINQRQQ